MEELYSQNAKIVYCFIFKNRRDSQLAQDLTQETFLQAYKCMDRYDGSCKISVWLCQIAKHLLYRYGEKHRHEIPEELEELHSASAGQPLKTAAYDTTYQQADAHIELVDVLKELQKLPSAMREVIYLRITGTLSFKEIGEILGKSENWARVNFYRGKELLLKGRMNDD